MSNNKKISIFIIALILVIYGLFFVFLPIKNVYSRGMLIKNNLSKLQEYAKNDDYNSIKIILNQTNNDIAVIEKNLKLLKIFKVIPVINSKFTAIENIVRDAKVITNGSYNILSSMSDDISKDDILIYLLKNKDQLKDFRTSFENLAINLNIIKNILGVDNDKLSENINFVSEALKFLEPFNEHVYDIIGKNGEKRYLLLFQNNTELRPTGGFIGTYGILTVEDLKIKDLFIDDIYHLDSEAIGKLKNQVPAPIAKYLETPEWYMRDCNFQPDFGSAMNDCIDLYKKESGDTLNIDGVIAVTPSVVGELLQVIGTQHVEGVLFESENFTDDLQKAVELYYKERGVTQWDRKDIIKSLAKSIIDGMKNRDLSDYSKMLKIVDSNLENKSILIYSTDTEIQKILVDNNWAGSIQNTNSDYLMIVDSNLASYKSDQFIDRNVKYSIKNENGNLIAQVDISYNHNGTFSWNSTRYRTYTRILVPSGSELIETKGSMDTDRSEKPGTTDVYDLYNKTIFGTFISIEPKKSKTLTFKYKLPDGMKKYIDNNSYKLFIQKQPGVEKINYELNILDYQSNFDLYNDKEIIIK